MKHSLVVLVSLLVPAAAHADSLDANPNDPGRVTAVHKGVWEIDLGGLAVLTSDTENETSVTRLSTDFSGKLQYFIRDNISVGGALLADYENVGGGVSATTFGGAAEAVLHLRLGLGAFFRPGIGVGALFGTRQSQVGVGMLEEASQVGVVVRAQLPIAYFASRRFLLQAGPQFNFTAGNFTPNGGMATGFTRLAGGFAVAFGYAF